MDHNFLIAHRGLRAADACNITRLFASLKGADDETLLRIGAAIDWHLPAVGWTRYRGDQAHDTAYPQTVHPYSALINSGNLRAVELFFKPGEDEPKVEAQTVSGPQSVTLPHRSDDYRQWGVYRDAILQGNLTALKRLLRYDKQRNNSFPTGRVEGLNPWVALAQSRSLDEQTFKDVLNLLSEHMVATTFVALKPGQKAPRGFRKMMHSFLTGLKNQVMDEACKTANANTVKWLAADSDVVVDLDQVATLAGAGAMDLAWSLLESFPDMAESKRHNALRQREESDYPISLARTLGRHHEFLEHEENRLTQKQIEQQRAGAQHLRDWLFEQAITHNRWNLFTGAAPETRTRWNEAATLVLTTFPEEEGVRWAHTMKAASSEEIVNLIQAGKVTSAAGKVRVGWMQPQTFDLFSTLARAWERARGGEVKKMVHDLEAFDQVCAMRKSPLPASTMQSLLPSELTSTWPAVMRQWRAMRLERATEGMAERPGTKPRL